MPAAGGGTARILGLGALTIAAVILRGIPAMAMPLAVPPDAGLAEGRPGRRGTVRSDGRGMPRAMRRRG